MMDEDSNYEDCARCGDELGGNDKDIGVCHWCVEEVAARAKVYYPEEESNKCPVCGITYGVAGLGAIGVSNGEERPCSWECEERYTEADTDRALAKTTVLVWLVVVVLFIGMLSVLAILPGGIA